MTLSQVQQQLGSRYLLKRELGGGSMAAVYLAEDTRHGRQVALKLLRLEYGATIAAERFLREIEIAARLQHPHIVPLLDSGEVGGTAVPGAAVRGGGVAEGAAGAGGTVAGGGGDPDPGGRGRGWISTRWGWWRTSC